MLVLGIESTCDETGVAVVRDGREILSNVVATQLELHSRHGGVVPELASRRHIDVCHTVLTRALAEAGVTLAEIDKIAVANGPGLLGALLVGIHFAQGLALALKKPLVAVNHVEAHLYAPLMDQPAPLPALGVVLSGGHTALLHIEEWGHYQCVGSTQDDAVGEAFDKVASLLGLPYPGGPHIERLAREGDPFRYPFKPAALKGRPFDFSFSGLKTAVLYTVKGQNASKHSPLLISEEEKKNVAASFQRAAFDNLVSKTLRAARELEVKCLLFGGGVTNNRALRAAFAKEANLPLLWPRSGLSLDNAAMIAGLGYHLSSSSVETEAAPLYTMLKKERGSCCLSSSEGFFSTNPKSL